MILTAAWVLLFLLLYLVWLPLYYRSIRFRVGERAVLLRSGVLLRKTAVMPVAAIQFTGLRALPGERILGLCTLQLVAAGARLRLPGLPRGEAEGLAARLANTGEGRP
jgi:membrane protein YdbS with pleckstrin-like domain